MAPFFFLSYGFANWVTGLRHGVPEVAFGWERHIPFLAWTIVPYWSTDLFYAASLFLCRTTLELSTHVRRLIAVQAICVAGFLMVPLRFGFLRPPATGLFGGMFSALMSFDRPFNQAPSLHVALTAVLWMSYGQHFRGWVIWFLRGWFVLMALSTLTTYQHHFIDVPAGLWVGLFSAILFPNPTHLRPTPQSHDPRRLILGAAYLAGAALTGIAAFATGGVGLILLWPAAALAIVAVIYFIGRPGLFRKSTDGSMSPAATAIFAPYMAAAWLNARWHTRNQSPAHEIAGGVWLGRLPSRAQRESLGMISMVDLTAELPCVSDRIAYRGIPMLDLLMPETDQLDAAVRAIEDFASARPTLVCCALGYSRSALAGAAWLIATGIVSTAEQAVEYIRARRPFIVVPPSHLALLKIWASARVCQ